VVPSVQQLHSLVASTYDEVTSTLQAVPIVGYDDTNNTVTLQIHHFSDDQVEAWFSATTSLVGDIDTVFGAGSDLGTGVKLLLDQPVAQSDALA